VPNQLPPVKTTLLANHRQEPHLLALPGAADRPVSGLMAPYLGWRLEPHEIVAGSEDQCGIVPPGGMPAR
jgi:hypothetical protein